MFQLFPEILSKALLFFIEVVIIYLAYKIINYGLDQAVKNYHLPRDAKNGINIVLKLFALLFIFIGIFDAFGLPNEFLISFSAVSGIIIGFASTEVVSQIILGMYLISSEPFGVRDLVNIDGTEGIVLEIGVNYTTIERFDGTIVRIPNKNVVDSQIKNYTIKQPTERASILSLFKSEKGEDTGISLRGLFDAVKDQLTDGELTQYTFEINVEFALNPADAIQRLDRVCDKYKRIFKYRPQYSLMDLGWRLTVLFKLISASPYLILHNFSPFIEDLAKAIDINTEG